MRFKVAIALLVMSVITFNSAFLFSSGKVLAHSEIDGELCGICFNGEFIEERSYIYGNSYMNGVHYGIVNFTTVCTSGEHITQSTFLWCCQNYSHRY